MSLVVEDGSGVAGANSYASYDDMVTYATARGISIPQDQATGEILLTKAMDYIEVRDFRFKGYRTSSTQALSWPREDVWLPDQCDEFPDNEVPPDLVRAQVVLAIAAQTIDLAPTIAPDPTGPVMMEQVGPIKTQYAAQAGSDYYGTVTYADQLLARLYKAQGRVIAVRV